jgi:pimeloyl-ACP methyl ester carboxylesterase
VLADGGRRPELVLVHGAWHGSWCWEQLVPELAARGWRTSTVDLPSTSGDPDAGMYADAAVVREHLESLDGPVAVLAHSYGGLPVTEVAATVPNVTQLIYLAAHMLDVGESLVAPIGGPWFDPAVALLPVPEPARELLFADVPADPADAAVAQLRPQSVRSFMEPLTRASWEDIPAAFVVCDEDAIFPPVLAEKLPPKADLVRRLPTSHSPFLSRPAVLADLIGEISTALAARPIRTS